MSSWTNIVETLSSIHNLLYQYGGHGNTEKAAVRSTAVSPVQGQGHRWAVVCVRCSGRIVLYDFISSTKISQKERYIATRQYISPVDSGSVNVRLRIGFIRVRRSLLPAQAAVLVAVAEIYGTTGSTPDDEAYPGIVPICLNPLLVS
jgi:hypothetical protein